MGYFNGYPATYQQNNYQQQNGILWIQGEQAAKSYLVAPNSTVLLMDSEASRFYLKSSDASGMPALRIFEYKEITSKDPQRMDLSAFATRAEFDAFRDEIQGLLKNVPRKAKKEAAEDESV